jgi:hypothetical protein
MPKERRYTRYKQTDVWNMLANLESALKVQVYRGSAHGSSVSLLRLDTNERLRAVILARSSDWYTYSLNCWDHGITAIVCGTHDSCVNVPILAMDTMKWYEALKMRAIFGPLQPQFDANDKPIPDTFDQARKSHYGHNMLIGALMCGREDARARLQSLPDRTRYRIESEVRNLHNRRQGRPLVVAPDPTGGHATLSIGPSAEIRVK